MWNINENNEITMTRGDTPSFVIKLTTKNAKGEEVPYEPVTGDRIVFALKRTARDNSILTIIEIPQETMLLQFKQMDTKVLGFGEYVYEISINNDLLDFHDTFIANKKITITEEIY